MTWQFLDSEKKPHSIAGDQLPVLVRTGIIGPNTLVWCEGMPNWRPLRDVQPELFTAPPPPPVVLLAPAPMPIPPPAPAPPPLPQPYSAQPGPQRAPIPLSFNPGARGPARARGNSGCRLSLSKLFVLVVLVAVVIAGSMFYVVWKRGGAFDTASMYPEFARADKAISGNKTAVARGNTREATEAAKVFVTQAEMLRDATVESGSGKKPRSLFRKAAAAMDGKVFSAWCEVRGKTAVFLLQVPELRKFTDEAKDVMATSAWLSAQMACLSRLPEPRPTKVYVAVKGALLYDRVMEGKLLTQAELDNPDADEKAGIEREHPGTKTEGLLGPIFNPPPPAPVSPKPGDPKSKPETAPGAQPKPSPSPSPSAPKDGGKAP